MGQFLRHPPLDQLELRRVLGCLSDETRMAIVVRLSRECDPGELRCREFSALGGKSNLTYHFDKLRAAGLIATRLEGISRLLRLRRDDLDARFPGVIGAIVASCDTARDAPHTH